MKRIAHIRQWLLALLPLLLLAGCAISRSAQATEVQPNDYTVLRIITESTTVDGMESQIQEMISTFESDHPNVNLVLEVLPADGLERQEAVSKAYVDISKGQGADIYLMPCAGSISVSKGGYQTSTTEPLFADVTAHMYRGTFADISPYYDADETLDKENLVTGVMDAGVVGKARYALPLRYSVPVLYADSAVLEESVLTEEILHSGVESIVETVYESKDPFLAANADLVSIHSRYLFNFFPRIVNYATGEVTLSWYDVSDYLVKSYNIHSWVDPESYTTAPHVGSYISTGEFFTQKGLYMQASRLESALDAAAIAKSQNMELTMIPLRSIDGFLIADVTYFGAVGANCADPELAYEFLRMFLSEDAQWEINRPRSTKGFQSGLIALGWPVRAEGAVEHLWRNLKFQLGFYVGQSENWEARSDALKQIDLTDEDLPGLITQVDIARFNNPVEYEQCSSSYISASDINMARPDFEAIIKDLRKLVS